ncbi:hypothetical protein [Moheibacter sediminis]|uniref:Uncharacterized protein n=1 Tax=Moheibacter sediminis TaxID=1434700 RepID=A0A1W2BI25_9FLAO|nr:hypothetical protein [Moheibacter sediminis]SMC72625.1 hypothetical protein SAMN06296427_106195 [Moheibacter sediminis]
MNKYCLLVLAIFGFLQSCSDSELITPGDEFQTPILPGTYTAELNGVFTDFSETTSVNSNDVATSINGANEEGQTISISFPATLAEATYTQATGAVIMLMMGGDAGTFMNLGATGQILPLRVRITELNMADRVVSGTFTGEVYNSLADETLTITNGQFKELPFTLVDGGDGILKAKFDNVLLDFSTDAVAAGNVTNATISGQNAEMQNLIITVPEGLEVGTLTEADEVVVQVTLGTSGNPNDVYSNYDAATETFLPFTLVITEITEGANGRVKGTFIGTIKKFVGGTDEEIEITDGEIDVPVN